MLWSTARTVWSAWRSTEGETHDSIAVRVAHGGLLLALVAGVTLGAREGPAWLGALALGALGWALQRRRGAPAAFGVLATYLGVWIACGHGAFWVGVILAPALLTWLSFRLGRRAPRAHAFEIALCGIAALLGVALAPPSAGRVSVAFNASQLTLISIIWAMYLTFPRRAAEHEDQLRTAVAARALRERVAREEVVGSSIAALRALLQQIDVSARRARAGALSFVDEPSPGHAARLSRRVASLRAALERVRDALPRTQDAPMPAPVAAPVDRSWIEGTGHVVSRSHPLADLLGCIGITAGVVIAVYVPSIERVVDLDAAAMLPSWALTALVYFTANASARRGARRAAGIILIVGVALVGPSIGGLLAHSSEWGASAFSVAWCVTVPFNAYLFRVTPKNPWALIVMLGGTAVCIALARGDAQRVAVGAGLLACLPAAFAAGRLGADQEASEGRAVAYRARLRDDALRDADDRLHAMTQVLRALAGRAHDAGSPVLAASVLAARVCDSFQRDSARAGALAERIVAHADDVLARTKHALEQNAPALRARAVDVAAVARRCVRRVRDRYPEARCALAGDEDLRARVFGDRITLARVLDNLAQNACEASPTGSARVTWSAREGSVVIVVEDDGPGFPAGMQVVPGTSSKPGGSGLGLYIASELVRASGGGLTLARSPALGGAAVEIWLPAAPSHRTERARRPARLHASAD